MKIHACPIFVPNDRLFFSLCALISSHSFYGLFGFLSPGL
jgi:hypothetical protein